jgi:hypothetical protein
MAVERYIEDLREATHSFDSFLPVFKSLKADKAIGKEEMDRIAHGYIGGRLAYKSRKAALDAIFDRFEERVYQASKLRVVARYRVG